MGIRTDLAMEAHAWCLDDAGAATRLPGVRARETTRRGITTTVVEVLNGEGAKLLDKPVGTYVTLSFDRDFLRQPRQFTAASLQLAGPWPDDAPQRAGAGGGPGEPGSGAGRPGPQGPGEPGGHAPSGPEPAAAAARQRPGAGRAGHHGDGERGSPPGRRSAGAALLRRGGGRPGGPQSGRICTTVQLADSGISPGSGVGNHRLALSRETLGVPVLAVGVPTVVEAATLLQDALGSSQSPTPLCDPSMVVAPRTSTPGWRPWPGSWVGG